MSLKGGLFVVGLLTILGGIFWFTQNSFEFNPENNNDLASAAYLASMDIGPQPQLVNPPQVIKAVYATSWSAGSEKKLSYLIKLIKDTELNAIVIDVKDFSGYIAYNTDLDLPKKYNAVELRIPQLNKLIKRLHDNGIYVIGRISTFEDSRLALARPELALFSSSTGATWKDSKGLMWMDPASTEVWDYNIAVAKEILARGFDEANFDYVRFASDGNLNDIRHPVWDEKTLKTKIIRNFFDYLRSQTAGLKISADLFGLITVNTDGLGIGQHLEYALPDFDAVAPMVYPSHYFTGFIGFKNPAEAPYQVIRYSMDRAINRIKNYESGIKKRMAAAAAVATTTANASFTVVSATTSTPAIAKMRPWIQDFNLGAIYDAAKVRAEIQAWDDAASNTPQYYGGWMLWNPANVYTKEALLPEPLATGH